MFIQQIKNKFTFFAMQLILLAILIMSSDDAKANEHLVLKTDKIALKNVKIIDGTGNKIQANKTVLIENGNIKAIQSANKKISKKYSVKDLKGHI